MKKILINGAGRGCLNLTKTANNMGLYTIVTGMDGPCIPIANKAYREVHPGHPDEVLEVAIKEKVNAVVTCCNDKGLSSVGYCCDKLNLTGLSYEAAQISTNKLMMKKKLLENNVRTAKYKLISSVDDLVKVSSCLEFPVIVKATDLQGSRGICIVKEEDDLGEAFNDVMSLTNKDYCIIEEFISGTEFGAQAFVYNGEILFVLPHGDEIVMNKTAVPIGHYLPLQINKELAEDVEIQACKAIKAIGLDNCAVNIDFIAQNNKAYIIELTGRGGANGLTDITGRYFGINYYEMMIQTALGNNPYEIFSHRLEIPMAARSEMIKSNVSGIVKNLLVPNIPDTEINMFISNGDMVKEFTNSNDAIGEIIVYGNNLSVCNEKIDVAINKISIELG